MIEWVTAFRKSNEYSVDRRAGVYVSSRKKKKCRKIQVHSSLPEYLGARNVRNSDLFWTIEIEYGVCIVHYIMSPAVSGSRTNTLIFLQQKV